MRFGDFCRCMVAGLLAWRLKSVGLRLQYVHQELFHSWIRRCLAAGHSLEVCYEAGHTAPEILDRCSLHLLRAWMLRRTPHVRSSGRKGL